MKNIFKKLFLFLVVFFSFWVLNSHAAIDLSALPKKTNITEHSLTERSTSWKISEDVTTLWFELLTIVKFIISWILIIFIVYAWIQMILSMWSDEDKLSSSKKQLRYSLLWLVFINIPGTIYNAFYVIKNEKWSTIDWPIQNWANESWSILLNLTNFEDTLNGSIVTFIEIVIFTVAIFVITLAWIRIITSRWREDQVKESKNKIAWSIIWLIFIWIIEAWKNVVYSGSISDGSNLFYTMEMLALFFAWPIAIFFLTLAWYYYITSNGEEERTKKAKNIVFNTLIAVIILVASHAFLKDFLSL